MITTVFRRYISISNMAKQQTIERVQGLIKSKPIFIASKATKSTISEITKDAYILELDELDDGADIQEALFEITGQKTVPNVFIKGEHIGGNSDVQALKSSDKLESKIKAAL
ncbi:hypothetical protein DFJ63DRAFT_314589 [Scheffersomyces coipomensis]|uniref:uncharacterized protein n=1 Tax=Scheffersomyces coipomensis TaxID=1788519 RepID=UPI00315CC75F